MKERPILFSGEMVGAILDGRKTQTRRVMKVQPPGDGFELASLVETTALSARKHENKLHWIKRDGLRITESSETYFGCPYGVPGDRLWVRETHFVQSAGYSDGSGKLILHRATTPDASTTWTPSIFMPRWASRITLEITDVRVQRVQEISEEGIIAEGISTTLRESEACYHLREQWESLWNSINAKRGFGWEKNPWVWALTFKRV